MGDCGGEIHTWKGPFQGIEIQLCDNHTERLSPERFRFEVTDAPPEVQQEASPVVQVP